jgi:membrane protein implicated in regulation of membrane protease activity
MTILWWHWLLLGLLLMLAELATPGGFYIIFFGLGAVLAGVLALAGVSDTSVQMLIFIAASAASLVLFRSRVLGWFQHDPQAPAVDAMVGETATAVEGLVPGAIGKVELRGSFWSARNASGGELVPGARCRVLGVEGLLLVVGPEGGRS